MFLSTESKPPKADGPMDGPMYPPVDRWTHWGVAPPSRGSAPHSTKKSKLRPKSKKLWQKSEIRPKTRNSTGSQNSTKNNKSTKNQKIVDFWLGWGGAGRSAGSNFSSEPTIEPLRGKKQPVDQKVNLLAKKVNRFTKKSIF